MPLFEFELSPLDEIEPWGTPPNLSLHWFGLSYGWYHLDLGAVRLLEYVEREGWLRFVDYQLARLHEDLIEMVPDVLEAIPPAVMLRFREGSLGDTLRELREAQEAIDDADPDLDAAVAALGCRVLDTGYLSPNARIWFWSDHTRIVIEWDNRDRLFEGQPAWTATRGRHELERSQFVEEVRAFDRRLMAAMQDRISQIRANWSRKEVKLDLEQLEAEQVERRGRLESALRGPNRGTDWQSVQRGLSRSHRLSP